MTAADPRTTTVLATAGRLAGIRTTGAELIRDGSNALFRLPDGVTARIGPPGTEATAHHQIAVARWLAEHHVPAIHPIAEVDQPVVVERRPVTWWSTLPEHRHATPAELGATLRTLHALQPPAHPPLPVLDPFQGLHDSISTASALSDADRTWLANHLAGLRDQHAALPPGLPVTVIHGDAWQGNLAVPAHGRPVLLDLDTISLGSPEWDLTPLAVDHTDFARITPAEYTAFIDAYGGYDVTTWPGCATLASLHELHWVCFLLRKAPTDTTARDELNHRLACLRGDIPKPWTWTAF
ncbi:phosphotransferase enzyme family protein [Saccharothrix lopnurensis]|uniref:Phosphotransferase enzyme family protein n=1 Tax=Saccharothrix lopnurensis TaxID=1670621 RepID=A0ABW1PDD9_9PSEU